jgi:hypothetical protein
MSGESQSEDDQSDNTGEAGLPEEMEREVEAVLGRFDATRTFLDELQTQQVQGRDAEMRDQLRRWADRKPGQFAVMFHTLVSGERFRRDVEATFGTKVTTALGELQKQYASLRSDFVLIRLERVYDLYRSDLRAVVTEAGAAEQDELPVLPVLSVEYREGSTVVAESQQEPSQALRTAANLVGAVATVLNEKRDEWDQQHPTEQRAQQAAIERLTDAVERLPDVEAPEVDGDTTDAEDATDDPESPPLLDQGSGMYRDRDEASESETPTYIQ